jgi:hypothetical protein
MNIFFINKFLSMKKSVVNKALIPLVQIFNRKYGENSISESFIIAMGEKLEEYFYSKTEIRMSKANGKIVFVPDYSNNLSFSGNIGTIRGTLLIQNFRIAKDIKWKSPNVTPIYPQDEVLEENIEFWFEDLEVAAAQREWRAVPPKLGFKLDKPRFELKLDHFNEHFYLLILYKENNEDTVKSTLQMLNQMLNDWNEASLAKNRRLGIVHNWKDEKTTSNYLQFYIDFGSASEKLLKQILEALNDTEGITEITITSYPPDRE